jgi:hypothetical protein
MADYIPPEIALEQRKLERRRKMAELIAQQDPMQGQMVSGIYVAPSPVQGIANLAKAYMGAKAGRNLDKEETDLTAREQQMRADAVSQYSKNRGGVKPNENALSMMRPKSARETAVEAMMSQYPEIKTMGQYDIGRMDTASDMAAQNAHELALQELKNQDPSGTGSSSPYYTPQSTTGGIVAFNNRTGTGELVIGPDGIPLVKDTASPDLQGRIAGAEKAAGEDALLARLPERGELEAKNERLKRLATLQAEYNLKLASTKNGAVSLLDEAKGILEGMVKPTSSGFGTFADAAGAFVGFAPKGSAEADQLRVIGSALVGKVPRMEGPQSNADAELYRENAGRIGDSTIPISRRLAALETVRGLNEKYKYLNLDGTDTGITEQAPQQSLDDMLKQLGVLPQ